MVLFVCFFLSIEGSHLGLLRGIPTGMVCPPLSVLEPTKSDSPFQPSKMGNHCGQASLLEGLVGQFAHSGVWAPLCMKMVPLWGTPRAHRHHCGCVI